MSELLILASDLTGRPVVSIDCGDDIAEVKDIVFDPTTHDLIGFTLNKRGWFRGRLKSTLPAAAIAAIGPAAVMIHNVDDLVQRADAPESLSKQSEVITVVGTRVLSANGDELGEISGVVIQTSAHPQAVGYQVLGPSGDVFVPISAQIALSDANILLPAEATDFIRDDLAGFGAAVGTYRQQLTTNSEGSQQ